MIFYLLIFLTLLILAGAMWYAYSTTRDPLHPLIYLAPLCIYAYVFKPILLEYLDGLEPFFEPRQILFVQAVNLLGVGAFCLGTLYHAREVTRVRVSPQLARAQFEQMLTPALRERIREIAWVLGGLAVGTYWIMIIRAGGLDVAYGQAYGGVRAASGYLGEMPLWCLASIGLLYLSWAGQRFSAGRILILLVVASPLIVHGLLGARRGPTFMVLGALLVGGYLVSPRRPRLITVVAGVFALGLIMLFLINNRERIFLGSGAVQEWRTGQSRLSNQTVDAGDDWVFSGGTILTSRESGTHFWGARFGVILFVRPIPRQIWPSKYIDTGFGWMDGQEDMGGLSDNEWIAVVGWRPPRGAAAGFVADLFLEFSFLGLVACYGFGWIYSYLWKRFVLERGGWSILYLFAMILSVYVPTQSVSAWMHRFTFLAVPTMLLWQLLVSPLMKGRFGIQRPTVWRPMTTRRRRLRRPNAPPVGLVTPP